MSLGQGQNFKGQGLILNPDMLTPALFTPLLLSGEALKHMTMRNLDRIKWQAKQLIRRTHFQMPTRPPVRCKHKGCVELVIPPARYCKQHQQEKWKADKIIYTNNPFYKSKSWIRTRDAFRARNPACNLCGRQGAVVDHIKAIKQGGAPFDWDNLQTLCRACDQTKRGKEAQQYLRLIHSKKP